jgi:hypothetical protein
MGMRSFNGEENRNLYQPNHICTISHAIWPTVQVPLARSQRVKSRPEKHIAAMKMKNKNSTIMPRRALGIITIVKMYANKKWLAHTTQ